MSDQFLAEIRIVGFDFAPRGWATCDGQLLPISQNTALFSLLGTTYGGDGKSTFALPNLMGGSTLQQGQGPGLSLRDLGEFGGEQYVTLLQSELPSHTHTAQGASGVNNPTQSPAGNVWGPIRGNLYSSSSPNDPMAAAATTPAGGNQPHNNLPPYLGLLFVIALQGIYPPRS